MADRTILAMQTTDKVIRSVRARGQVRTTQREKKLAWWVGTTINNWLLTTKCYFALTFQIAVINNV